MEGPKPTLPYGSWPSPLPLSLLTEGIRGLGEVRAADGVRWWLEGRPDEDGIQVLVRLEPDGTLTRLSPEGFNVRTRVHEYGGGATLVEGDVAVVSEFRGGRLHRITSPGVAEPLTPERAWRFADPVLDRSRDRIVAVREDHEPDTVAAHGEARNELVAIDVATGDVATLVAGRDFYAAPRLSPDGSTLAWLEWSHPNMPWDGTELRVAAVAADGSLGEARTVAGSASDWVSQPRWSPDGVLHFVAEPDDWMSLFTWDRDAGVAPVAPMDAEFSQPDWVFGQATYGWLPDGSIVAVGRSGGRDRLFRIPPNGAPEDLDVAFTEMDGIAVDGWRVVLRAATPSAIMSVVELDVRDGSVAVHRRAADVVLDPADTSTGRLVEFPTTGGRTAFGLFYPPVNAAYRGPDGERPPLVVTSHGGPTSSAWAALTLTVQIFTSRGFAVLDVDYGGSTGYGREYRRRLEGEWGVVDLDDCVNGARWLSEQALVDGERMAIRGGSASGYTTLCAITFRDVFRAGVSMFGLGNLEAFVGDTHKFESRYLDRLIGPYPEARELYRERSPVHFADRIRVPVLVLQGLDDQVVPPSEAERIVDALWERRVPHAYVAFEGEDHGFRQAKNIIRAFEVELSFYGQVFGFEPADPMEPLELVRFDDTPG